jgi:hypothetical protein
MNLQFTPGRFLSTALLFLCATASSLVAEAPPDTTGWKDLFASDLSNADNADHWKW